MYWDVFLFIGGVSLVLLWRIGGLLWDIRNSVDALMIVGVKKDIKDLADDLFHEELKKYHEEAIRRQK